MLRNLNLFIPTEKKPIEVSVHIDKLTNPKIGLHQIYLGRRIRMVTVLTTDDQEKPTRLEDIECIVSRSQCVSVYEFKSADGSLRFLPVDKKELFEQDEDAPTSNRNLTVIAIRPNSTLKPFMFEGNSYEMMVHGPTLKKVKQIDPLHHQIYNLLYHGLLATSQTLIAKYTSFGREKFCAIYPVTHHPVTNEPHQTMLMSNLIHSNYYRSFSNDRVETFDGLTAELKKKFATNPSVSGETDPVMMLFAKIVKNIPVTLESVDYVDEYEIKLQQTIDVYQRSCIGEVLETVPVVKPATNPLAALLDL